MSFRAVLILFLFVPSCIDPVDFSEGDDSKSLVVDGLITNAPGPYIVKLERTSDYNITSEHIEEVKGTIVFLSDDVGNSEILTESHMPEIAHMQPSWNAIVVQQRRCVFSLQFGSRFSQFYRGI